MPTATSCFSSSFILHLSPWPCKLSPALTSQPQTQRLHHHHPILSSSMAPDNKKKKKTRKYGSSRKSVLRKTLKQEQVNFNGPISDDPVVAIIGGGMSGLLCALQLQKRGFRSTVFDTYERLREVNQRAEQFQELFPTQSKLFQDIRNIPQEVFEYNQRADRMNYSSQNFQFPPGGFYPTPPTGAGGFYSTAPTAPGASSSGMGVYQNMGFFTPTMNHPLFNASPGRFAPDFQPSHQPRHFTPVRMPDLGMPSSSQYQVTDLGNDEDEEEAVPVQRRRRQNRRPPCGTSGNR